MAGAQDDIPLLVAADHGQGSHERPVRDNQSGQERYGHGRGRHPTERLVHRVERRHLAGGTGLGVPQPVQVPVENRRGDHVTASGGKEVPNAPGFHVV